MTVLSDAILALEEVVNILRSISPTIEQGEANASPPPPALPAPTSQPVGQQNGLIAHYMAPTGSTAPSTESPTISQADPRDGWCDQLRRRALPDNLYRHLRKAADVSPGEYLTEAHIRAMGLPLAQMAARTCPKPYRGRGQ